jgi:hypothetical protein
MYDIYTVRTDDKTVTRVTRGRFDLEASWGVTP